MRSVIVMGIVLAGAGVALAEPMGGLTALPDPVPAAGEAFVRGTSGEPFTQTALVQGCGTMEGGQTCLLYAEGWRYAATAGQTGTDIMAALARLAPNTPVTIMGDVLSYGDITAEVILSRIEPGPLDPKAALRLGLQGEWVSTDDADYTASIIGSEFTESSGGEVTSVSVLSIGTTCSDGVELGGDVVTLVEMGGDPMDGRCWSLESVTGDTMTVFNLPRGNVLSFQRR